MPYKSGGKQKNSKAYPSAEGAGAKSGSGSAKSKMKGGMQYSSSTCGTSGVDDYAAPFKGGMKTGSPKSGGRKMRSKSVGGASHRGSSGHGY